MAHDLLMLQVSIRRLFESQIIKLNNQHNHFTSNLMKQPASQPIVQTINPNSSLEILPALRVHAPHGYFIADLSPETLHNLKAKHETVKI